MSEAGTTGISAEDIFIAPLLEAEQEERRAALLRQVKGLLTETQYRRLWMYRVKGMNETQIAEAEHVGQPRICRSLRRAIKILEKIFPREGQNRG